MFSNEQTALHYKIHTKDTYRLAEHLGFSQNIDVICDISYGKLRNLFFTVILTAKLKFLFYHPYNLDKISYYRPLHRSMYKIK